VVRVPVIDSSFTHLRRYWPWLTILLVTVAYYHRFIKLPAGMLDYPHAASCLLQQQPLQVCQLPFTYPPIFAFLMLPFYPLPLWLRDVAWYLITVGATIGAFRFSERIALGVLPSPLDAKELIWFRCLALLLTSKLILAVFENQAYDALVMFFIVAGLAALMSGREAWGGASLAFAAAVKATPLIFLPYLLWKRHFMAAVVFIVVFFVASFAPDLFFTPRGAQHGYFVAWLIDVAGGSFGVAHAKFPFWYGSNILNHSLHGAVSLNIDETKQQTLNHEVLYAIDAIFILIVGTMIVLSPRRNASIAIDGSLLLISMLMLSPMTSRSHYIALLLPYMTLIAFNMRDSKTRNLGRAILVLSFTLVTLTGNDIVGMAVTVWSYRHSSMVLGTLMMLIYFAAITYQRLGQKDAQLSRAPLPASREAGLTLSAE
jgi:Glycosyltransferase family 87